MYSTKPHAFDIFLLIIPTRSNNPTAYLPRFFPLCAPDIALKPIISLRIFHFRLLPQSSEQSFQGIPCLSYQLTIHPQLLILYLGPTTRVVSKCFLLKFTSYS